MTNLSSLLALDVDRAVLFHVVDDVLGALRTRKTHVSKRKHLCDALVFEEAHTSKLPVADNNRQGKNT